MEQLPYKFPPGLSPDEIRSAKAILARKAEFMDNPALHAPNANLALFKDQIDMRDAELVWHALLVRDYENHPKNPKLLLSANEEKTLFLQLNYARMRVCRVHKLVTARQPTNRKQIRSMILWDQIAHKVEGALTAANVGLIYSRFRSFNLFENYDFDNLLSEALLALLRSIRKFDVGRGWKFSTYACNAINKQLFRCLSDQKKRYGYNLQPLEDEDGHQIELADIEYDDMLADTEEVVELRHVLKENFADLTAQERRIIKRRYGLENGVAMTLEEVGTKEGVTKERIRQLQNRALSKLRGVYEAREFQPACEV